MLALVAALPARAAAPAPSPESATAALASHALRRVGGGDALTLSAVERRQFNLWVLLGAQYK